MSNFFINTGGSTAQSTQSFNGFDSYAAGSRQTVPNIATSLRGQSTVGARNIAMVYQMGLRVGGGTYDGTLRAFIGCWRIWNNTTPTAAGATATSLSASAEFRLTGAGNISTTKVLTIRDMLPNVILNGGSTYLFGFNNANTSSPIWAGFSRTTGIATQDVFQDTLSSTPNNDSFVLDTTSGADPGIWRVDSSIMGQVYYFTIPPAPVITSITKLSNGVRINFTVNESSSSTTTGCKAYFSSNNVTFTQVTGTFAGSGGSYTFQITTTALTLGQFYYFEVCALNAVTNLDNFNNPSHDTRSLDSNSVLQQYGDAPPPPTQNVTISGNVTYNGSAQAYTLTGSPASPAPTGSPASFTNVGTYTSANISVTAGSGYTLGSVTGSFVISQASITAMTFTLNGVPFTSNQTVTSGTNYTIAVSSATSSVPGATFTPTTLGPVSTVGSYSLSSSGTGNYQGGPFTSPLLTITNPPPPTQNVTISGNVTYNGSPQAYTLTGTPASPAPSGTPSTFTNADTYTSANISVTAGSGYTLGSVTGSFVINPITITGMTFTLNGVSFTTAQSRTAGTNYTIAVSSTTPSGGTVSPTSTTVSSPGSYTLSSSGSGNYQGGPFTSPVLTLTSGVNFIKVRNASNTAWENATLRVRNGSNTAWVQGTAKVRNSTNTDWINNY
jgi:hypothetical protein